jgi:Tol biopolymer transport system component
MITARRTSIALVSGFLSLCVASCQRVSPLDPAYSLRGRGGGAVLGASAILDSKRQQIIFASPTPRAGSSSSVCDIWSMALDGTQRKQLTFGTNYDGQPVLSPDGETIAFVSEREGLPRVFLMDVNGSNFRRLTEGPASEFNPVFSSDGSRIMFSRRIEQDGQVVQEIFATNTNGKQGKSLLRAGLRENATAFMDCTNTLFYSVVLPSNDDTKGHILELVKLSIDDGTSTHLLAEGSGYDICFERQLVTYVTDETGQYQPEVHVADFAGQRRVKLTDFRGYINSPCFSSCGNYVVFVVQRKDVTAHGNGRGDIYIASVDGKLLRRVGPNWLE